LEALRTRLLAINFLRNINRQAAAEDDESNEYFRRSTLTSPRIGEAKRAIIKPRIGRAFNLFQGPADSWAKRAVFKPRIGRSGGSEDLAAAEDMVAENSKRAAIFKPRVGK
jgi:hypothetical protein